MYREYVPFLRPHKKGTKESGTGKALSVVLPHAKDAFPCEPIPAASPWVPEELNPDPEQGKSVPTFSLLVSVVVYRCIFLRQSLHFRKCGRGFSRGRNLLVSPLWLISLVTLLFSDKKVTDLERD